MTWATKIAHMQVVQDDFVQSKCNLVRDMCNRGNVEQTMCNRGNVRLGMCRWYMMRMGVYG